MNVLITGVNGQDGSYLAELLLQKGHKVFGVVRRSSSEDYWRLENVLEKPDFTLLQGDVTDLSSVLHCFTVSKPRHVYNLAAQSHVGTSFTQPGLTTDVTYKGALNVLEASRLWELESSAKLRVYQASSSEMFGCNYTEQVLGENDAVGVADDGRVIYKDSKSRLTYDKGGEIKKFQNERTPFSPCSPYGVAKLAAHNLCKVYRKAFNLDARPSILFNHEGPRRGKGFVTKKITEYIGELMLWFKNNQVFELGQLSVYENFGKDAPKLHLGNCDAYRDWGHSRDYVEAMYAIMNHDEYIEDIVIGTGQTHTIKEFVDAAFNYINVEPEKYVVYNTKENMRPYEVDYLRADASLAKEKLGWQPKVTFTELVQEMVDYELSKRNIRRPI